MYRYVHRQCPLHGEPYIMLIMYRYFSLTVSSTRRAVHHVLRREARNAVHQLLQGELGRLALALHGPGNRVHHGMQEAGAGRYGEGF